MPYLLLDLWPGRVAQSVGPLTRKSEVLSSIPGLATYFRFSPTADSRKAVVRYWQKYVHEVLVNSFGGLSLSRKSVVRLTDRPDMTLDVFRGCKTTTQQQQLDLCCFIGRIGTISTNNCRYLQIDIHPKLLISQSKFSVNIFYLV